MEQDLGLRDPPVPGGWAALGEGFIPNIPWKPGFPAPVSPGQRDRMSLFPDFSAVGDIEVCAPQKHLPAPLAGLQILSLEDAELPRAFQRDVLGSVFQQLQLLG